MPRSKKGKPKPVIKCPLCDEPTDELTTRDGQKMCPECAEHQDNEAALEESYGDAMFDDGGGDDDLSDHPNDCGCPDCVAGRDYHNDHANGE